MRYFAYIKHYKAANERRWEKTSTMILRTKFLTRLWKITAIHCKWILSNEDKDKDNSFLHLLYTNTRTIDDDWNLWQRNENERNRKKILAIRQKKKKHNFLFMYFLLIIRIPKNTLYRISTKNSKLIHFDHFDRSESC